MNRILREFKKEPITILCSIAHERYQSDLAKLPYNFIVWDYPGSKPWRKEFAPIPPNHTYIKQLTSDIHYDCILSQHKFGQYQTFKPLAHKKVPMIQLEHTTCGEDWPDEKVTECFKMQGDVNVFITEFSARQWGFGNSKYEVVNHMVDTNKFAPKFTKEKSKSVLSVVNDLKDRNRECGFDLWRAATHDINTRLVGTCNHGIGKPARDVQDLMNIYGNHLVFLNTSLISPLPKSLLEAMSCGLCVVSAATCQIPTVIEHNVNGFLYNPNNPEDANIILKQLLNSPPEFLVAIGQNARKTIQEKFSEKQFLNRWQSIIEGVCE